MSKTVLLAYLKYQPFPLALLRPEEAKRYPPKLAEKSLDIGCGDGFFAKYLFGEKGVDVGVDISDKVLLKAKHSHAYNKTVKFDGIHLPFPTGKFKTVVTNCVLEHVDKPLDLLSEISRVVCRRGKFYFTVPTIYFETLLAGSIIPGYKRFMNRVTRQKYYWDKKRWFRELRRVGFSVISHEEFLGSRGLKIFDLTHWLSIPSIITKLFTGRWAAFPEFSIKLKLLKRLRRWSLTGPQTPGAFQFFACRKIRS